MTLELTPLEFHNLEHRLSVAERRRTNHSITTSPERDAQILLLLKAHKSNMDIKRELRTSDATINKIRKENGLWGA